MVDNRSAGFFGIGGAFNFKSGDISGTAAKNQDDKMGPGTEYGMIPDKEEEQQSTAPYVDRSAQLRATLNSLAMMNVADILKRKKRADFLDEKNEDSDKENKEDRDENEEFVDDFSDDTNEEDNEYY